MQELKPTTSTVKTTFFAFCPRTEQKNPNFSSPAILQHALLIQFPHTFGSWTPPLLHIHYITGSHHTGTWFLIPLLCWWHTALSLSSTRLHGGHLCMDERTSPTAQPGKDWASCLPYHSNSTAGFHHHARFFYNIPSSSVRNLGVIFDDQLTFKEHIAKLLDLHNIRKIRPSLHSTLHNLLSRLLSFLDWTTAILF